MIGVSKAERTMQPENVQPVNIPLANITAVEKSGIRYADNKGDSAAVNYTEAYKGWCQSKNIKRSKPKYVCDRTKSNVWKLIFYTERKIIFCADQSQEDLWIDIINKITRQGYATFDWN